MPKDIFFEHKDYSSMVIGSSNLTSNALKVNYEHNVLLSTMKNGDLVDSVKMNLTCYGKRVPH